MSHLSDKLCLIIIDSPNILKKKKKKNENI